MSDTVFQSCTPREVTRDAFVARFSDIYEYSAWIAEHAYDQGMDPTLDRIEALNQCMARILLHTDGHAQPDLINAYKDKFCFPFTMPDKGSNRLQVLGAFEEHNYNTPEVEFSRVLKEINTIASFRLDEI